MHRFSAAAAVCFIATSASAFAPSRRVGTSVAYGTTNCNRHGRPFTTSALQATFCQELEAWARLTVLKFTLARINDIKSQCAKFHINKALKSLKDPEMIRKQSLIDMQV
jgi:hypothetical protein